MTILFPLLDKSHRIDLVDPWRVKCNKHLLLEVRWAERGTDLRMAGLASVIVLIIVHVT